MPVPPPGFGAAYTRLVRRRGTDLASVTLCASVDAAGVTQLAYGSVGPRAFLVRDDSGVLADPVAEPRSRAAVLDALLSQATPSPRSIRASPDYRLAMLRVLAMRALGECPRTTPRESRLMAERLTIDLTVNGRARTLDVAVHHTLLEVLRDDVGLTGTKECCVVGECGACTVLVDGRSVNSCLMLAVEADGAEVVTVEGLAGDGELNPLQAAFLDTGAAQCGFCIPGQLMSATALLEEIDDPSDEQIQEALAGNLCRCAGYEQIFAAVHQAARGRSA